MKFSILHVCIFYTRRINFAHCTYTFFHIKHFIISKCSALCLDVVVRLNCRSNSIRGLKCFQKCTDAFIYKCALCMNDLTKVLRVLCEKKIPRGCMKSKLHKLENSCKKISLFSYCGARIMIWRILTENFAKLRNVINASRCSGIRMNLKYSYHYHN